MSSASELFRHLETELMRQHPHCIGDANKLAQNVIDPARADTSELWPVIWNKPLFANTKVEIAQQWIRKLDQAMLSAFETWGDVQGKHQLQKLGKGKGNENFQASDSIRLLQKDCGVAYYRLFAIQGAATGLRNLATKSQKPFSDFQAIELSTSIALLKAYFGYGWGHITVLHLLTDLGLACKPDLHLVQTMNHLGLYIPIKSGDVPSLDEAILINDRVKKLSIELYGESSPKTIRYLDKCLMEFSVNKLFSNISNG